MYLFLARLGLWLAQKLATATVMVAVALVVYGVWLYLGDREVAEPEPSARVTQLHARLDQLREARTALEERVAELQEEVRRQQERAERAGKIIETLRQLESWWDRWFGNPEQQEANARQIERMQGLRSEATQRIVALGEHISENAWRLEQTNEELTRTQGELTQAVSTVPTPAESYLKRAWAQTRWYLLGALLVFFLGPTVFKLFAYYIFAPLLSWGRPIRFSPPLPKQPEVAASRVSVVASLWPGEVLRVKEKFLQASDEGLEKRTRFVLDWRIPFTSVACGLIELVEMVNPLADEPLRVTFSNAVDPHIELAVITLPEEAALILRPSFLAGVAHPADRTLRIRRRWMFFRWQSWVTLQFRFFEFRGPCRLIVAGSRGVRAEVLTAGLGSRRAGRRTNQRATIGFTPDLDYLPVRAETFWSYYRGMNPLFDDLFAGAGVFVLQETSLVGEDGKPGRFWATLWSGVLKVFGL